MALISLQNITWGFADPPLLEDISLQIEKGERIGLLGRNGAGKSTLLKILLGKLPPDSGLIQCQQGLQVGYLTQSVAREWAGSIFDVVADGLGPGGLRLSELRRKIIAGSEGETIDRSLWEDRIKSLPDAADCWDLLKKMETVLSRSQLPAGAAFSDLSAGMKRRTLFARALVGEPDILLLDEPTNHLDIESILWMESFILRHVKTLVFVTHDRSFLQNIATRILELDRGRLSSYKGAYDTYLNRRQEILKAEENQERLFDKKLAQEEAWIRQGIKARRTRNEGRVTALFKMREAAQARRKKTGNIKMQIHEAEKTGKLVIEVEEASYSFGDNPVIRDFSTIILRGDRVGIIGPNGVGKTTLLNLLLKNTPPQSGRVRHGTHLEVGYFDQLRLELDEGKTVQENIAEGNDFIIIQDRKRHVIGYLEDFLFTPEQSRSPVKNLSGGEKSRLMLAKLFSRPANLLVLDEPTNDLDIETLELLEELLFEFQGTLLLVSHDRTFLNNVVTSTLAFEGQGRIIEYAGGYDDWLIQRTKPVEAEAKKRKPEKSPRKPQPRKPAKLGFKEKRELEELPQRLHDLEEEQKNLYAALSDPMLYQKGPEEINRLKAKWAEIEEAITQGFQRWEELEEKVSSESKRL
jgi:ABC transport system ATP-binding/permease protein